VEQQREAAIPFQRDDAAGAVVAQTPDILIRWSLPLLRLQEVDVGGRSDLRVEEFFPDDDTKPICRVLRQLKRSAARSAPLDFVQRPSV
jgi:hypothetical protein